MWIVDKTQEISRINLDNYQNYSQYDNREIQFEGIYEYSEASWLYRSKKARDAALAKIDELLEVKSI